MRVFDIGNKARTGFWCAANDEAEAKQIALAAGHAKTIANLRSTDITAKFTGKGADAIKTGTQTGHLVFKGVSYTFEEIIAGVKREGEGWVFV